MIRNLYILKTRDGINTLYQYVYFLFKLRILRAILAFGIFYYRDSDKV